MDRINFPNSFVTWFYQWEFSEKSLWFSKSAIHLKNLECVHRAKGFIERESASPPKVDPTRWNRIDGLPLTGYFLYNGTMVKAVLQYSISLNNSNLVRSDLVARSFRSFILFDVRLLVSSPNISRYISVLWDLWTYIIDSHWEMINKFCTLTDSTIFAPPP